MKRKTLFTIDIILSVLLIIVIISSILQEALFGESWMGMSNLTLTLLHIFIAFALMTLCYIHIKAHYGSLVKWKAGLKRSKVMPKILFWIMLATLITGILSTVSYFTMGHSGIGGVHGKIGFVALAFMLEHLILRFRWFFKVKTNQN